MGKKNIEKKEYKKEIETKAAHAASDDFSFFTEPPPSPETAPPSGGQSSSPGENGSAVSPGKNPKSRKYSPDQQSVMDTWKLCYDACNPNPYIPSGYDRSAIDRMLAETPLATIIYTLEEAFLRAGIESAWVCNNRLKSISEAANNWAAIIKEVDDCPVNARYAGAVIFARERRGWEREHHAAMSVIRDLFGDGVDPLCPPVQEFLARPATARIISPLFCCIIGGHTASVMAVHGAAAAIDWDNRERGIPITEWLEKNGLTFNRELVTQEMIDRELAIETEFEAGGADDPEEWLAAREIRQLLPQHA